MNNVKSPAKINVHLRACVRSENRVWVRLIRGKQYYCVGNILAIIGRPLFRQLRRIQNALMNSSGSERRYYYRFVFFSPPTYYLFGSIDITVVFYVRPIGSPVESIIPSTRTRCVRIRLRAICRVCFPVLSYCIWHVHVSRRLNTLTVHEKTGDDYNRNTYTQINNIRAYK